MNAFKLSRCKIMGVLAVAVGVQAVVATVANAVPHQAMTSGLSSTIVPAASPHSNTLWLVIRLSEDTYLPPDNGGPSSTQGSGTR